MTVAEAIRILRALPQDATLIVFANGHTASDTLTQGALRIAEVPRIGEGSRVMIGNFPTLPADMNPRPLPRAPTREQWKEAIRLASKSDETMERLIDHLVRDQKTVQSLVAAGQDLLRVLDKLQGEVGGPNG